MHARHQIPFALTVLADQQDGVLTREQVLALGLSRAVLQRLCDQGTWHRMARGVVWTRTGDPTWPALARAGTLLGGDHARLGPEASGHVWRLRPEPTTVDVLVPYATPRTVTGPWRFVRERAGCRSGSVGDPPRLTAVDTVLDLTAHADDGEVVALVTRAVQQRLTTTDQLREGLAGRPRHSTRALLDSLLVDVANGVESGLELRYLRDVERAHGLPTGTRNQYRGGLRYRSDVRYDDFAVLVELDGRLGHEGSGRFRDYRRDNAFALQSLVTLRYGWYDVVDLPCHVAAQVAAVLHSRGWDGVPSRCHRCIRVM